MQAVREITAWADGSTCNHTYLLDGDKMWAYIPVNGVLPRYFSKPIIISRSGRKFERLATSPFSHPDIQQPSTVITVQGSKGQTYSVDTEAKTCTCSGYTFRGTCKHVKDL